MPNPLESDPPRSQTETDLAIIAAELNQRHQKGEGDDQITQGQFNAAVRNSERVAQLRESGNFRILSVDGRGNSEKELVFDFENETDALMYV